MEPTTLEIALGDDTTVPEDQAFAAYERLTASQKDPDFYNTLIPPIDEVQNITRLAQFNNQPIPEIPTTREALIQRDQQLLKSYRDERKLGGNPLFPTIISQKNKLRNDTLAGLYTKKPEEVLSAESFAEIERRSKFTANPEEFKQRLINKQFLSATLGRKITSEEYPYIRQIYARQHLGLTKDTSETAVFTALQTRFKEEQTATETLKTLSKQTYLDTIEGKPRTEPDLSTIPQRLRPQVREEYGRTQREASRTRRRVNSYLTNTYKQIDQLAANIKEKGDSQAGPGNLKADSIDESFFYNLAADLPDAPADRQIALSLIAQRLQKLPATEKTAVSRVLQSIERGAINAINDATTGLTERAGLSIQNLYRAAGGNKTADQMQQRADLRVDARNLRQLFLGEIDPTQYATDNLATKSLILAGQSAWTLPASFAGPAGFAFMSSAMAGSSYQRARTENPEANPMAQANASFISGATQAATETALNKLGFKIIGSKLPVLAGILNKTRVTNSLARGAIAFPIKAGAITATEYTEEAIQGATDTYLQDIALELSNIAPKTNWNQFLNDWATIAGQEQRDTLLAIAPFAVVGAGAGSIGHFKYGAALAHNRTVLHGLGIDETTIRQITSTTDIKETDRLIKEAFDKGLETRTTEERTAALEVLRELNRLATNADMPRITKESEYTYTFTDPITRVSKEFETEEEALIHWRNTNLQVDQKALDKIARAAREGSIDFLTREGTASEDTTLEEVDSNMPLNRAVITGLAPPQQLEDRLKALILQQGMTPAQASKETGNIFIRAMRFTKEMRDGSLNYIVRLFKNADSLNIYEDFAEDTLVRAYDQGLADPQTHLQDLLAYQKATGDTVIDPNYQYNPANLLPIIEGFSALARARVIGLSNTELIPESTRQWLEVITTYGEHSLATAQTIAQGYASDLQRTATLKDSIAKGILPPRLISLIDDAIGVNETEQLARLEKKHQDQLLAEAMGGFPEIQDQLQGKIPHPETLRSKQHPLAGEVRRIWESMKKPTRARNRNGRTIDRTNEANAYFLPIGEMLDIDTVREAMNEKGFDFQTPADMLDALESSISYNKPQYATASRGNLDQTSFSLGISPTASRGNLDQSSFSIGRTILPPTTQKSREVSPTAQSDASFRPNRDVSIRAPEGAINEASSVVFTKLFQSAPSEEGDVSPRGDGETDTSFSIGRARENYEKAKNSVLYARKELSEVEASVAEERKEWELKHGKIHSLAPGQTISFFRHASGTFERNKYMGRFNDRLETFLATLPLDSVNKPAAFYIASKPPGIASNYVEAMATTVRDDTGQILAEIPGYDLAPFPESSELITAREYLAQAEANLYLAEEEFDPDSVARENAGESARQWKLNQQASAFAAILDARDAEAKNAAKSFVARIWETFAKHDELFQFARSTSKDATEIAKAVSSPGKLITVDNSGDTIRINGANGYISIMDADTSRPYIAASSAGSKGKKGGGGSNLYVAALDWIHNNGKRIKDDPGGLTDINAVRRTSNQAASAIRWGSTAHLKPHAKQAVGKWTKNDLHNTSLLITKEMENTNRILPQSKALRYDFATDTFTRDGNAVTTSDLETLIEDTKSFDKGIGISTLQRAVITASAIDEFQRGTAESIIQQAESDLPASLTGVSYSLGPSSLNRIEAAIARKLTAAPDERAAFYNRLRDRLAGLSQQLEDMDNGIGPFARKPTDEAGEERRRIQDAIAEARAIIDSLPIEARGRVNLDFADITNKTTEKGRADALIRLIAKADDALEIVLKKEYLESFARTLDLASPELRQNRSIRGRLTPETQRLINTIIPITHLTPVEAAAATIQAQAAYDAIEAQDPDTSDPEAVQAWQNSLATAQETLDLLNTFAALTNQTAAEIAAARQQLLDIYTKGRTARQLLDQARNSELASQRREIIESLGGPVSQNKWKKRVDDKGLADLAEATRLELSSFHENLEWMFPESITARDYQPRIRASERAFTRAKIDARQRFETYAYTAFNLTGKSRKRKLNRIIADLSTPRDDWNIEIAEATAPETISMTEEQAASILDGTLKPGWESDLIAMESLRQSLADFRLQRQNARDQSKAFSKKVIRFQRYTKRHNRSFMRFSDLEALYHLQLADQDQYLPALDKYGFTASVLEQMRSKIDPRALTISKHLRKEYDAQHGRLNPVHQRLFGLDMPRIRNYAPGIFESLDSKGDISMDGANNVNAMTAGFTKARTHHMARPRQTNALAAYWSSLESTEYFIAWAETMRDIRQVFRSPDVRRVIEGNYGMRAARNFSTWLDVLETDGRARALEAIATNELVQNTLTTQSAVGLAFNIGTIFKQWSAGIGHFMHMPTTDAIKATYQALSDPSSLREIWSNEAIQQRILNGMTPEDKRMMDAANASPSLIMEFLEKGRLPIAYTDAGFTTLTATAAYKYQYDQATKAGLSDAEAHRTALDFLDFVVTRTAQPATTQDKSLAENTARGFNKALFLFKSDPRQKLAKSINAVRLAQRGDITKTEAFRTVFYSWMIYGLMAQVATDIFRTITRDDDEEENWNWQDYIAAMIAGPISGLALFGGILEYGIRTIVGAKTYQNSANPLDKAVVTSGNAIKALLKAKTENPEIDIHEILQQSVTYSSGITQLIGTLDPRAAILPASLRLLRDTVGTGDNILGLFTPETEDDIAAKIIRENQKTTRDKTTTRTADLEKLATDLMDLDPGTRQRRLNALDPDTRARIIPRLKKAQMTPNERALSNMPLETRNQTIQQILDKLPAEKRQPLIDRLTDIGIYTLPNGK